MSEIAQRLQQFWHWWLGELTGLIPARWRPSQETMLALWRPDRLELWRRSDGETIVWRQERIDLPLTLRLPESRIWRRSFSLPRSAQPFLRQIFGNEMDRRTPWRADQVYFHLDSARDPEDRSKLKVSLALIPRKALEPALAELARRGWRADRVELCDATDPSETGPLVALQDGRPVSDGAPSHPWAQKLVLGLGALAIISLVGQSLWLAALSAQLQSLRSDVATTRKLANEVTSLERRSHFPRQRQSENASPLALLDAVSHALPDDSWAQEVTLGQGQIEITGRSQDAAKLLALLEQQGFAHAEFRAPVTPAEGGGQKFQLQAKLPEPRHDPR